MGLGIITGGNYHGVGLRKKCHGYGIMKMIFEIHLELWLGCDGLLLDHEGSSLSRDQVFLGIDRLFVGCD